MHAALRNIHLAVGLLSAVFLVVYAVSAAQMAYPVYRIRPVRTKQVLRVPPEEAASARRLARWLMTHHDLRGNLTAVRDEATLRLTIVRPGTTHDVEYERSSSEARVSTAVVDAIGMLNRLHHVSGVRHDYWVISVWGWLLFGVSGGLLILAATGTAMWFQRHRERGIGAIVLIGGLAWGLTLLVLNRIA